MTEEEKEKIINAFNNAWNKKIASENSYGKLASKEMFENKEEIKTEISTDCSYYKDVVKEEIINSDGSRNWEANILLDNIKRLEQENLHLKEQLEPFSDEYFKDLTNGTIAQLAKTSLRNTADNCRLTHALEEIRIMATKDVSIESFVKIQNKINEVLGCEQ